MSSMGEIVFELGTMSSTGAIVFELGTSSSIGGIMAGPFFLQKAEVLQSKMTKQSYTL